MRNLSLSSDRHFEDLLHMERGLGKRGAEVAVGMSEGEQVICDKISEIMH
jgi:hypothetical protein